MQNTHPRPQTHPILGGELMPSNALARAENRFHLGGKSAVPSRQKPILSQTANSPHSVGWLTRLKDTVGLSDLPTWVTVDRHVTGRQLLHKYSTSSCVYNQNSGWYGTSHCIVVRRKTYKTIHLAEEED